MSTSSTSPVLAAAEGESYTIGSWKILARVLGSQTNGAFELYHFTLPPGESVAYHVHNRASETIHVLAGNVEFTVAGAKFPGSPGSTAFVPAGVHHGFDNATKEPAQVLLCFSPSTSQNEFFRKLEEVFAAGSPDLDKVKQLQKQYDQELITPGT